MPALGAILGFLGRLVKPLGALFALFMAKRSGANEVRQEQEAAARDAVVTRLENEVDASKAADDELRDMMLGRKPDDTTQVPNRRRPRRKRSWRDAG